MRVVRIAGAVMLLSTPLLAQDELGRRQLVEKMSAETAQMARVPLERSASVMKGAPYSAETVVENNQTLSDGNRITRKTTGAVYRDGEGRTRREEDVNVRTATPNGFVSSSRKTISIVDPVGGFSYSLDPENKVAWRTPIGGAAAIMGKLELNGLKEKMEVEKVQAAMKARAEGGGDEPSKAAAEKLKVAQMEEKLRSAEPTARGGGGGRGGAVASAGGGARGAGAAEGGRGRGFAMAPNTPLEHKTIEGVAVEGRKTTTVIPAGQVGNEQPITITSEEWRSPDLNVLVLTRYSDPRTGESIYRLQNIVRAEPDRSLFMVPPDYTVKDTGIRRVVSRH